MNKLNISMGYKKGLEVFFCSGCFFCFAFCFTFRSHQYVAFLHFYLSAVFCFFICRFDALHVVCTVWVFERRMCVRCVPWCVSTVASVYISACVLSCIRFRDWLVSLCIVYCCCCIFIASVRWKKRALS